MSEDLPNVPKSVEIDFNSCVGMNLNLGTRFGSVTITSVDERGEYLDLHYLFAGKDAFLAVKKDQITSSDDGGFKIKNNVAFRETGTTELILSPKS